ncbi:MAG: flagellar basal-body MS-ring/collar protein FliF [Bryobacteraceae bacterium]
MPKDLLAQLQKIASGLSVRQWFFTAGAAIAVVVGLYSFSTWNREHNFKSLYTNMAPEDAGAVVAKLKEGGVEYRVTDGGASILVPSEKVAESRIQMASAGLPKSGRIGFELFDKTNFGISDFTEQVNYRRAIEGELERSIKAISEITSARVHITFPKDSVFIESRLPAKASVLLGLKPQARLTPQNVSAITHLIASAVEGLAAEAVSVMDERGNLLNRPKKAQDGTEASDELLEYRQKIERDLLTKINVTLEPLLGAEKFRAGVSVECDFSSGEQSEETYDPEKSVMTNSQKTEETTSGTSAGGIPGTASNLPRPAAKGAGSNSSLARRSETIAYQTSKLVRRIRLPQGAVKRVSASVLLDQSVRWEGNPARRILVPPSAENIRAIREVVSAAIGLTATRGDQLVIETLPFESTLHSQPASQTQTVPAHPSAPWSSVNWSEPKVLIGLGIIALLIFAAVAIVIVLRKRRRSVVTKKSLATAAAENNKGVAAPATSAAISGAETQRVLVSPEQSP